MLSRKIYIFPGINSSNFFTSGLGDLTRLNYFLKNEPYDSHVKVIIFIPILSWIKNKQYTGYLSNHRFYILPHLPIFFNPIISIISLLYYKIVSYLLILIFKPTVIQCELGTTAGLIYKHKNIISDFHGDLRSELDSTRPKWIFFLTKYLLYKSISNSNKLIFVSKNLKQKIANEFLIDDTKCSVIPCLPSSDFINNAITSNITVCSEFDIVFCYIGGAQFYQRIDVIAKILAIVSTKYKVKLKVITSSKNKIYFDLLFTKNLPLNFSIEIYNDIENNNIPNLLIDCDIGFLMRDNLSLNIESSPTKLREYLLCGLSLISTPHAGDIYNAVSSIDVQNFFIKDISYWCNNNDDYNEFLLFLNYFIENKFLIRKSIKKNQAILY